MKTTEETHTPAPWYHKAGTSPHFQGLVISETTGESIAVTYNDETSANARLIAAAPSLLAVVQAHVDGENVDMCAFAEALYEATADQD
jgi:phosphoglycerate dehydrogenase-like enzyme